MLQDHAAQIVDEFANPQVVFQILAMLSPNINSVSSAPSYGDVVFENAVLFNRDALILREFMDAIKIGDSGRIIRNIVSCS